MSTLNRSFIFSMGFIALLLPGFAAADGTGLMLGGGIYYTQIDDDLDDFDWDDVENIEDIGAFFDDKSYGLNGSIGWRFNKWIMLDAGYWDLGEFKSERFGDDSDRLRIDVTAFTAGGMLSVPLWILDIYGRAGMAWWEADSRAGDTDDNDPYYGLGVALNIGASLDLYLEINRFDFETDLDMVGLGARFTF